MTSESKREILIAALVLSALVHVGVMFYAKPKTMTRIAGSITRSFRRAPMRVTKDVPRPEPVKIEAVEDLSAIQEAPTARTEDLPIASAGPSAETKAVAPKVPTLELSAVEVAAATPVFDARPPKLDGIVSEKIPMIAIEAPPPTAVPSLALADVAGSSSTGVAAPAAPMPSVGTDPNSVFLPTELARLPPATVAPAPAFVPAEEVYEKVDEKVVEAEKAAVKELIESEETAPLSKFVTTVMTTAREGKWRYCRILVSPRASLGVVPKDIVVLLDASGSIGSDRLGSIRKASKGILRSALNTGDRFNLVAFRDRFSYAFRGWQDCTKTSFEAADRWLNNLVAHGRTDVFSTIASVLTLPRDPTRPLIALVVTDGDANTGVSGTAEILSRFTALNDGLISIYMYGVKSSANAELIDTLTHGNRGESFIFEGWRWAAGEGIEGLSERFRDPVLTDLRVIFSSDSQAEAYPHVLRNLYRGGMAEILVRVPASVTKVSFSLMGLNGKQAYEGFFTQEIETASAEAGLPAAWHAERALAQRLQQKGK